MMFGLAIHETAGVGIGAFIGVWLVLFSLRRAGQSPQMLRDSPLYTALVAGFGAWCVAALVTMVIS